MESVYNACRLCIINKQPIDPTLKALLFQTVERQIYIAGIPILSTDWINIEDMYISMKSDRILKRVFTEACMEFDIRSSILFTYGRGTFGDYDLLFYLYMLMHDNFRKTKIYKRYFNGTVETVENRSFSIFNLILAIVLLILIIILIVYLVRRISKNNNTRF